MSNCSNLLCMMSIMQNYLFLYCCEFLWKRFLNLFEFPLMIFFSTQHNAHKMVEDTTTDNYFYINIIGQIESCWFPVGCQSSKLYCRYDITAGPDWQLVSGLTAGITQCAEPAAGRFQEIVFNMPIEVMYKSTNPFGCKCGAILEAFIARNFK